MKNRSFLALFADSAIMPVPTLGCNLWTLSNRLEPSQTWVFRCFYLILYLWGFFLIIIVVQTGNFMCVFLSLHLLEGADSVGSLGSGCLHPEAWGNEDLDA